MKLSKRDTRAIEEIISRLDRSIAFIMSPDTMIARRTKSDNRTVFRDDKGDTYFSITKDIGNELCHLYNARRDLKQFITPVIIETV